MQKMMVLSFILAFLLTFCLAAAQVIQPVGFAGYAPLEITNKPVQDKIEPREWAEFEIQVKSNQRKSDTIMLSIQEEGVEFSSITKPTSDLASGIPMAPGEIKTTKYLLKPSPSLLTDPYKPHNIALHARMQESGVTASTILQVTLLPEGWRAAQFVDANISIMAPEFIDPRNVYSFKLSIQNNNKRDLGVLRVVLRSALFDEDAEITIGSLEGKTVDFPIRFAENQQPRKDQWTVEISGKDGMLYRKTMQYEIVSYRIPFSMEEKMEKRFLKNIRHIIVTNNENVAEQQWVKVPVSTLERLLSKTAPSAQIEVIGNEPQFVWELLLNPGESKESTITTSYRTPLLILLIIAVLAYVAYMMKDPLVILKESQDIKTFEGGIVELKVGLTIKNRTNREYHAVEVVDKIPSIATYKKGAEIGEMRPSKVVQRKDGIILKWNIGKMESYEERILAYSVKSKLGILGDFRMPRAIVTCKDEKGTKITVKSNQMDVSSAEFEEEKKEE